MSEDYSTAFSPSSRLYRFSILIAVSLMLVGSYFAYDSVGALAPLMIEAWESIGKALV